MERFRLDQRMLPTFLYRVDYPGSQTSYTRGTGFTARDTTSFYSEDSDFRKSVVEAFTWSCRNPSPYIAVFSEKSHAENWAHSWSDRNGYVCDVVTLDTRNFSNTHVFHLSALVAQLGIVLPDGAQQHQRGAYLCLHRIPAAAVCATEATSSILHRRNHAQWARESSEDHSIQRPGTHWSGELYGYYDSDDEVEENNINDDIINAIEGKWD